MLQVNLQEQRPQVGGWLALTQDCWRWETRRELIRRSYTFNPHSPPLSPSVLKVVFWLSADCFVLFVQNSEGKKHYLLGFFKATQIAYKNLKITEYSQRLRLKDQKEARLCNIFIRPAGPQAHQSGWTLKVWEQISKSLQVLGVAQVLGTESHMYLSITWGLWCWAKRVWSQEKGTIIELSTTHQLLVGLKITTMGPCDQ